MNTCWHCGHRGEDVNTFLMLMHLGGTGLTSVYVCDDSVACKENYFDTKLDELQEVKKCQAGLSITSLHISP